ncbi:neutral cholesterol ester hydrolase 1-like [Diadema antillarum]|uniref:neutral cholesterol ester hydrolase 1-like n=1 Tax=Diadema antillarum TaxID=105358 RepID=UPI003A8AAE86
MRSVTTIPALIGVLFLGYVFYTPIPEDLADPMHFRFIVAGLESAAVLCNVWSLFQPLENFYVQFHRFAMELPMPAPDLPVPGSNVSARYTDFAGVQVLLYEPLRSSDEILPGFVYFHGGGYALGSARGQGPFTRLLAEELRVVLVSVDYRLAPEHVFPAAFDDALAATKYFLKHAADYGVDTSRVAVGGDSAGGHLAAGVAQHVFDDPTVPNFKLQVLFYPWIQFLDCNTPSLQFYEHTFGKRGMSKPRLAEFISGYYLGNLDPEFLHHLETNRHTSAAFKRSSNYKKFLNHSIIFTKLEEASLQLGLGSSTSSSLPSLSSQAFREYYKPQQHFAEGNDTMWEDIQEAFLDPRNLPLFRDDFRGLPKAFIATGERDHIRDDGIFYAHALEQGGVEVTWKHYPGAWHGIAALASMADVPTGAKMLGDGLRFIKENI